MSEVIRKIIWGGVLFSFCITLSTTLFYSENIYVDDSASYTNPAESILAKGTFDLGAKVDEPMFFRTPGYSLLLSMIYLAGDDTLVIFFQWAMFLLTGYICFLITYELFNSKKLAFLVGAISLFDVGRLYFVQILLTETLFTLLFVLALYVLVRYAKTNSLIQLIYFGLLISAAMLTRPMLQFLLPLLPLLLGWLVFVNTRSFQKTAIHAGILSLIFILLVGGWAYRNYTYSGVFDVSSNKGDNGYYYKKAVVLADLEGVRFIDKKNELQIQLQEDPEFLKLNEMERSRYMVQSTLETLKAYPFHFLKIQVKALLPLLFDPGSANFALLWGLHQKNSGIIGDFSTLNLMDFMIKLVENHLALIILTLAGMIYLIPLYISVIFGLRHIGKYVQKEIPRTLWIVLGLIFLYMLYFSLGVESFSRLRVPIMSFFYVLAGLGLYHIAFNRKGIHV